jgi:transcription elongation factor GreA
VTIIPFSKQGFADLKQALEKEIAKRPLAVESLKRGREMGDLSENGLYKAAKMELVSIDRQIRHLRNLIQYGRISEPKDSATVQLGHTVIVETENGKKELSIVGEWEANPRENKISHKSPIGHNLMSRKVGEKIMIRTPNGFINYKILSIQ